MFLFTSSWSLFGLQRPSDGGRIWLQHFPARTLLINIPFARDPNLSCLLGRIGRVEIVSFDLLCFTIPRLAFAASASIDCSRAGWWISGKLWASVWKVCPFARALIFAHRVMMLWKWIIRWCEKVCALRWSAPFGCSCFRRCFFIVDLASNLA